MKIVKELTNIYDAASLLENDLSDEDFDQALDKLASSLKELNKEVGGMMKDDPVLAELMSDLDDMVNELKEPSDDD